VETPDVLPTPQGGAQTPGYFFARMPLDLNSTGRDALGILTS